MTADPRPGKVPAEVTDFFAAKDVKPAFSYLDVWRQEHLAAFSVAKAVETDVIQAMREGVAEAIHEGLPFTEFRKRLEPILADKGWWGRQDRTDPLTGETKEVQLGSPARLRTVFDTNLRVARAAGQWDRIQKTKKVLPYLKYRLGPSEVHRPDHEALNGTTLPVDHEFWNTGTPPNGYGCKCWIETMTGAAVAADGGPSEAPELLTREFVNPRTGQKVTITAARGVDPGFAFNPGKDRLAGLKQIGILK